jgi:amino acid transporter
METRNAEEEREAMDTTSAGEATFHDAEVITPERGGGGLRHNAVSARLIAITTMAGSGPAAAIALSFPFMVAFAGQAAIFALVITTIALLALVNTFAEFAKRIPSAGSLFAWNSAGLGSNVGFVFGWFFVGGYILILGSGYSVFGGFVHDYLSTNLSIGIPWWIFTGVVVLYTIGFAYRGIHISSEAAIVLLAIEMGVLLVLALWLLISGDAHPTLHVFNPDASPGGWAAIGLAISFGLVNVTGFEEAATLGEEAENPRRSVGRGLFFGIALVQLFHIFVGWMLLASYPGGPAKMADDPNAVQTLATTAWHSFGAVITLILISSVAAYSLTAFNAGIRVVYSLSRVGVMPAVFGRTTRFGTPGPAMILVAAPTVVLVYILGAARGPIGAFGYYGFMVSIGFAIMYVLTNVALITYIRKHVPKEFSLLTHVLLPLIASVGVGYALYRTVHPLPPAPFDKLPWVVLGWALIGVALLIYLRVSGRADVEDVGKAFAAEWEDSEAELP